LKDATRIGSGSDILIYSGLCCEGPRKKEFVINNGSEFSSAHKVARTV
jgi:hypothetical protein